MPTHTRARVRIISLDMLREWTWDQRKAAAAVAAAATAGDVSDASTGAFTSAVATTFAVASSSAAVAAAATSHQLSVSIYNWLRFGVVSFSIGNKFDWHVDSIRAAFTHV